MIGDSSSSTTPLTVVLSSKLFFIWRGSSRQHTSCIRGPSVPPPDLTPLPHFLQLSSSPPPFSRPTQPHWELGDQITDGLIFYVTRNTSRLITVLDPSKGVCTDPVGRVAILEVEGPGPPVGVSERQLSPDRGGEKMWQDEKTGRRRPLHGFKRWLCTEWVNVHSQQEDSV